MKTIALFAAALAVAAPGVAAAQSTTQNGRAGLSLADFQSRRTGALLRADTNGDGRLSASEWAAARPDKAGKAPKQDPSRKFGRLDRNRDGYLDRSEIGAFVARRFARLDANGDGVLTRSERAAHRQARRQRG
jgi:hypothetical protein